MKVVIATDSVMDLRQDKAETSSGLFVLKLARQLLSVGNQVFILSGRVAADSVTEDGNLRLLKWQRFQPSFFTIQGEAKMYRELEQIGKEYHLLDTDTTFLTFGYSYQTARLFLKLKKQYGVKLFTYIFDTHRGVLASLPGYKQWILERYHQHGIHLTNRFDGVILFRETAYKDLGFTIPYHISRIGVEENEIADQYRFTDHAPLRAVYAGALEEYNGIRLMLDAFGQLDTGRITLDIYGNGSLENVVRKTADHVRIRYHGRVEHKQVVQAQKQADLLLNLRDLSSPVCRYAFPSKLIEYLASGVPVCSTRVLQKNEFEDAAFVLDDFSTDGLLSILNRILENPAVLEQVSARQIDYVKRFCLWKTVPEELTAFIKSV